MCRYRYDWSDNTHSKSFRANPLFLGIDESNHAGINWKPTKFPLSTTYAVRNDITLFSSSNVLY